MQLTHTLVCLVVYIDLKYCIRWQTQPNEIFHFSHWVHLQIVFCIKKRCFNGYIRIKLRSAKLIQWVIIPWLNDILGEPYCEVTSLNQRPLIFLPVLYLIQLSILWMSISMMWLSHAYLSETILLCTLNLFNAIWTYAPTSKGSFIFWSSKSYNLRHL